MQNRLALYGIGRSSREKLIKKILEKILLNIRKNIKCT